MTQKQKTDPFDKKIGLKLKKIRDDNGISKAAWAKESNIDYRTLWNCENGYNTLSINVLLKLFKGLKSMNIKGMNNISDIDLNSFFEYVVISSINELDLLK